MATLHIDLDAPTLAAAPTAPSVTPTQAGRWLRRLRGGGAADRSGLAEARGAFSASLADLPAPDVVTLRRLLEHTGSLRELWHLRPEVFRRIALHHSQWEAERRLARLDRCFPAAQRPR